MRDRYPSKNIGRGSHILYPVKEYMLDNEPKAIAQYKAIVQ